MTFKIPIPEAGDTLTVNCEIITIGGQIVLEKGEKVIVSDVVIEKGTQYFSIHHIYSQAA